MRAVIQRVTRAKVTVNGRQTGNISEGLMVLVGVHRDDSERDVTWMADKLVHLRIFEDQDGQMNRSLLDSGGEILIVSQFTLLGDCRKGRRPSWSSAAPPDLANTLYLQLVQSVKTYGVTTATGEFQSMMDVSLVNNGPVTLLIDSQKNF
jgi:D-tyrosyl-tRNA(Tyr) deacylase